MSDDMPTIIVLLVNKLRYNRIAPYRDSPWTYNLSHPHQEITEPPQSGHKVTTRTSLTHHLWVIHIIIIQTHIGQLLGTLIHNISSCQDRIPQPRSKIDCTPPVKLSMVHGVLPQELQAHNVPTSPQGSRRPSTTPFLSHGPLRNRVKNV